MRRKLITTILTLSLVFSSVVPCTNVKAATTVDKDGDVYTDIEITPEDLAWNEENIEEVKSVELNELGRQRVFEGSVSSEAKNNSRLGVKAAATSLPREVDNSTLEAFPGIGNQGAFASCVSFAATYYSMSHMVNLMTNRSGKNIENIFSPKWTYNILNNGYYKNYTSLSETYDLLKSVGAVSWADFPYSSDASEPLNYTEWDNNFEHQKKAQKYSVDVKQIKVGEDTKPITSPSDTDLTDLKNLLLNGYVLNFYTYAEQQSTDTIDNDPSTNLDDNYVGEEIVKWRSGVDKTNHALTVVGYNDDIWVDINGDGKVQQSEKGAIKIADSYGERKHNKGFYWVSYDALNRCSQVPNLPSECTSHIPYQYSNTFYYIIPKVKDDVKLYLQFSLLNARRNQTYVKLRARNKYTGDVNYYYYEKLWGRGGSFNAYGETEEGYCYSVIDLNNVVEGITPDKIKDYVWTLNVKDGNNDQYPTKVSLCEIVDEVNNRVYSNISRPTVNGTSIDIDNTPVVIDSFSGDYYNSNKSGVVKGEASINNTIHFKGKASGGCDELRYKYCISPRCATPENNTQYYDSNDGSFDWSPKAAGIYSIQIIATDSRGNSAYEYLYYDISK